MIYVLATVQVVPGCRDAFLAELNRVVNQVRQEDGCLDYGPAVEIESRIPVQAEPRPDVVTIIERWQDLESLARHLSAPHMVHYRERVRDLVKWIDLRVMEPA